MTSLHNRFLALLLVFSFVIALAISGCSPKPTQTAPTAPQQVTITDMAGRQVTMNVPATKAVAVGPGALRLYCYINSSNGVVGIEEMDKKDATGRPYMITNPSLASLPAIGPGGPNTVPDPEKILAVAPEVIFDTFTTDKAALDELQSKTSIPVVALSYGKVPTFGAEVNSSLKLIGKIMGQDKRADDVVAFMNKCKQDLDDRTKDVPDSQKPSVYVGGLGSAGKHGIESTQANYSLFLAVHAKNVVDETGKTGGVMIDKEKLVEWNPDKIFIDESGLEMIKQDYQKNPNFYNSLSAVKNGELYAQMPYNYYTTNIDTAIADAYYLGIVLYPDKFKDVDPQKKAEEIYQFLLGKSAYDQMVKDFGGFKKLTLQ